MTYMSINQTQHPITQFSGSIQGRSAPARLIKQTSRISVIRIQQRLLRSELSYFVVLDGSNSWSWKGGPSKSTIWSTDYIEYSRFLEASPVPRWRRTRESPLCFGVLVGWSAVWPASCVALRLALFAPGNTPNVRGGSGGGSGLQSEFAGVTYFFHFDLAQSSLSIGIFSFSLTWTRKL